MVPHRSGSAEPIQWVSLLWRTAFSLLFCVCLSASILFPIPGLEAALAANIHDTGDPAALTAPGNDDFASATILGADAGSLTAETNAGATAEAGEPNHNGIPPSRSVWYRWTPSVNGNAVVAATTFPYATWDIVIGVYTGSSVDALTPVAGAGGIMFTVAVEVEFRVEAGTTYYLAIDGRTSLETGSFDLAWSIPSPPNDDFAEATTLTSDSGWLLAETNDWATAEPGEPSHNGLASTPARSVWYQWTAPADGTAVIKGSTRPYSSSTYIVMAAYTGAAVDALTEVTAWGGNGFRDIKLEFAVAGGTTYHIVLDSYDESKTGSFDLTWALSPPTNDDFANPTVLAAGGGTLTGESNENASPEIGEPAHAGVPGTPARSVWYQWTPTWDGSATLDIDTPSAPGDWDSVAAVYTGSSLAALSEVAAASTAGESLHLAFAVVGGTTYRLVVDGYDSTNRGGFDLTWNNNPVSGTFIVTKTEDTDDGACDADCSLREAVVAANATGGDDTIQLPAGLYQLTLDTHLAADHFGSLEIERESGTTTILGAGRDTTIIDATTLRTLGLSNPDRVFTVGYHAGLALVGVTVTGGYTENATSAHRDGGGIWNWNGYLWVTDCLIEGNVAGENGGGIANTYGPALITNTIIRDNNTDPPEYNTTGYGGGIYNSGTMTITNSTIELNASDKGGGIANWNLLYDNPNSLEIENSVITNNTAWRGGGMANMNGGIATVTDSLITSNHATRAWDSVNTSNRGGGISNVGSDLTVIGSTITGNETWAHSAIHPSSGGGGGIATYLGTITVIDSTVSDNEAICDSGNSGNFAICGRGGGIINAGGRAYVFNSTLSGNMTTLLNYNQLYWRGGGGGGGFAHMPQLVGVTVFCPVTLLDSVTITGNSADHGGGIDTQWETLPNDIYDIPAWAVGDGYECPDLYVRNTIVAENSATISAGTEDCWGSYTSEGHNLTGTGTGCPADGIGDLTTSDPWLGPLANNGGDTETHELLFGSPAIDAGDNDNCLAADQRGVSRPQGAACDIGAFEFVPGSQPLADLGITKTANADPLMIGETILYTVTVVNSGPDSAENVVVTDHLPGSLSYISAVPDQGGCAHDNGVVTCSLGDMPNAGQVIIQISVMTTSAGIITNSAAVTSDTGDPVTANNQASEDTTVLLYNTFLPVAIRP